MSVTSQLKDPESPLNRFYNARAKTSMQPMVDQFNRMFQDSSCLIYDAGPIDYLMSGGAFQYAFRWWLTGTVDKSECIAYYGVELLKQTEFFDALVSYGNKKPEFIPVASVILYLFEQYRRAGKIEPLLATILDQNKRGQLLLAGISNGDTIIHNTMRDIALLYNSIGTVWESLRDPNAEFIVSPTFEGSSDVGGADGCFIHGNVLWDVKVTKKRYPLTRELLLQQITYVMLDYHSEYDIQSIGWYYPRQQRKIVVPVGRFIKDVDALRAAWQEFHWEEEDEDDEYSRDEFEDYHHNNRAIGWSGYHKGLDYENFRTGDD